MRSLVYLHRRGPHPSSLQDCPHPFDPFVTVEHLPTPIRPVRLVNPIRGGPVAPPIVLARVMLHTPKRATPPWLVAPTLRHLRPGRGRQHSRRYYIHTDPTAPECTPKSIPVCRVTLTRIKFCRGTLPVGSEGQDSDPTRTGQGSAHGPAARPPHEQREHGASPTLFWPSIPTQRPLSAHQNFATVQTLLLTCR